jgi:rod shape-determining protein MreD
VRQRRWTAVRAVLVLLVALILQATMLADLRVAGALGDLMLALVVAAGISGGPDRGVAWGFAAGVAYDLVLDTPFGLSALTYALVGYAVGLAGAAVMRTSGWWPVGIAAAAAVVQVTLYTALGNLLGVPYPFGDLPAIALVEAAWCAAIVLPAIRVMWWIHGRDDPDRLDRLDRLDRFDRFETMFR